MISYTPTTGQPHQNQGGTPHAEHGAPDAEHGAPLACPRCGVIDRPTLLPGSGPHAMRAVCSGCGRFLRWISLLAPSERLARKVKARMQAMLKHPPSAAQLDLLQDLGDKLSAPATMAEASQRIEALKQGKKS